MARPVTISNAQILEAARHVFLREGYGASTAAIARAAEVSEGILFKRFGSKDDLFHAALEIPRLDLARALEGRVGRGDVKENLVLAAQLLIDFFGQLMPVVMTLWRKHAPNMKALWQEQEDPQPLRTLRDLAGYIQAEIEQGRLAAVDAWLLARCLVGSTHHYAFLDQVGLQGPVADLGTAVAAGVSPGRRDGPAMVGPGPHEFARSLVDTLWRGLAPLEES